MSFQFLNRGQQGDIQEVTPIDTFIDPVSKIRVSNPSNLIDTDFEYGLQPTKWETVELINNTPAFFSKGGDTTISDITGITTNNGTREITVTTAFPHNLAVGIPIRVAGTKSVTADGSYIINATPSPTSFTYLSRADQDGTVSIFDLYSSIITGEFFQGSQVSISDAEGITTDGEGTSTLTVKTENNHGFGNNTPFYFLNLNSTISQEFESANATALGFDPTNSATAQEFDGSNTLLQTPIDLSNSANNSLFTNQITSTNPVESTITVQINAADAANWGRLNFGDPLYYSVTAGGGFFQQNPRGVVFIGNVDQVDATNNTATFQVSQLPEGSAIPILANMQGIFQIADQARTFAGNNVNEQTQIELQLEAGQAFLFDGGNQGYDGDPEDPVSNVGTVTGFSGANITLFTSEGFLDYYVGAMLKFTTDGTPPAGLVNNGTYFVTSFTPGVAAGTFTMTVAEFPNDQNISPTGGSGGPNERFSKIGVSVDKDIVHIKDSFFDLKDMLEYSFPESGNFQADEDKLFYFVKEVFDQHNYRLNSVFESNIAATGGSVTTTITHEGRDYTVHRFTQEGTFTFEVTDAGTFDQDIKYVIQNNGSFNGDTATFNVNDPSTALVQESSPATQGSFTVTVGQNGRVDIVYPQDDGPNEIPFNVINPVPLSIVTSTTSSIDNTTFNGNSYTIYRWRRGSAIQVPFSVFLGNLPFNSTFKYVIQNGRFGETTAGTNSPLLEVEFTPENKRYFLTLASGGSADIAYRPDGGNNEITFAAINPVPIIATGGSISTISVDGTNYRVHQFTSVGTSTFNVSSVGNFNNQVEYLVIAGGGGTGGTGGGRAAIGGGGGAGGYRCSVPGEMSGGGQPAEPKLTIQPGPITVVVGAGGAATTGNDSPGTKGNNSSLGPIVSEGGGRGPTAGNAFPGGGSGGGGGHDGGGQPGAGIPGQGFAGGWLGFRAADNFPGGGGGGAGGVGGRATSGTGAGGNGGPGLVSSITGTPVARGGGGAGGGWVGRRGVGGSGGGGNAFQNGAPNTGGGAGNGERAGGSGIVIVRYPLEPI